MNSKNRTLLIVVGVIVVILGLAGIAVLAGGGDDSSSGVVDPSETTVASESSGDVEQNRPIEVEGDNGPTRTDVDPDPAVGMAFMFGDLGDYDFDPTTGRWTHKRGPVEPPLRLAQVGFEGGRMTFSYTVTCE